MAIERRLGYLAQICLFYNVVILISVVLNLDWAKSRAAGGQFDEFPNWIRALYFVMAAGMVALSIFLRDLLSGRHSERRLRASRYLSYLFIISTAMQLISKSADERFNALPAGIIAYTFFVLSKERRET